jgi:hypothetical protein
VMVQPSLICVFYLSVVVNLQLRVISFIDLFKALGGLVNFLYRLLVPNFIDFCCSFYYIFLLLTYDLICSSLYSFLRSQLRLLT